MRGTEHVGIDFAFVRGFLLAVGTVPIVVNVVVLGIFLFVFVLFCFFH